MRRMIAALVIGLMAAPLAAQDVAPLPGFLIGAWVERDGEKWATESWSGDPSGLRGATVEGSGDHIEGRESLIIERRDGTIVLIAQPAGAEPVVFPMVQHDERSIAFANPAHDYPQRIRYWREGDGLRAEISQLDGSQAMSWSYVPTVR